MAYRNFSRFAFVVSLTLFAALSTIGCSAEATDPCDAALDCGTFNQAQYDACVADAQRFEITAQKTGCDAELQTAIDCSQSEGICENGQYTAYTCDPEWQDFKGCIGDD